MDDDLTREAGRGWGSHPMVDYCLAENGEGETELMTTRELMALRNRADGRNSAELPLLDEHLIPLMVEVRRDGDELPVEKSTAVERCAGWATGGAEGVAFVVLGILVGWLLALVL